MKYLALLICASLCVQIKEVLGVALEVNANLESLLFVQVIARHGDRAPIHPYPNDPYQNISQYWPNGWYQLTQIGVQQEVELGRYLRQRYQGFLPNSYSQNDFLAKSSDNDRTIQSAEACMAGLYPSDSNAADWRPVPIHTIPTPSDIWIDDKSICPRYITLLGDLYKNSVEISQINLDNQDFIQFIAEKSGSLSLSRVTDLNQVQDCLRCEHFHNLTLPEWATDELRNKLDHFKALTFKWKVESIEMKRLRAGPMVGLLLDNCRSKINGATVPEKMHLFLGHDSTLSGVLAAWNIFEPHIPPYATSLMLELHSSPGGQEPNVQIFYRNESNREPYLFQIPGCGSPCLLSQLEDLSKPLVPLDWDAECLNQQSPLHLLSLSLEPEVMTMSPALMIVAGVFSLMGAVVGSALLTNAYIKRGLIQPQVPPGGGRNYQSLS